MNTLVWISLPVKDFFFPIQSLLSLFSINDTINSTSETRDSLGDYKEEKKKQTNKQTKKSDLLCCQYMHLSGPSSQRVVK